MIVIENEKILNGCIQSLGNFNCHTNGRFYKSTFVALVSIFVNMNGLRNL